jgi:DNA-binding MarR family transcriptional regulator
MTRFYDDALGRAGITATQFAVLRAVERTGTVTMSRVAEALIMDRTSLYRAVAPLLRQGVLRRAASGDDGRAKCLTLTPLGRARIAEAAKEWEAAQERVVRHVGQRRWRRLSGWLLQIADEMKTWTATEAT